MTVQWFQAASDDSDAALFDLYSDLYKNDYGVRPRRTITVVEARAWIDARPNRACGYGDPVEFAEELEWLEACDAVELIESDEAPTAPDFLDFETRGRRVIFFQH